MIEYKIYRLCRNEKRIKKLKTEDRKYKLPPAEYITGIDLYTFINDIIKNCPKDYALICHDDVFIPFNIDANLNNCIDSANKTFGEKNWALIGNAGIEALNKKTITHISDPHTQILPYSSKTPKIVESVDGNCMLLNIKNIREKNISLPKNLNGFHLYDLILSLECYKKGLLCAVSSWLYVMHTSKGNYDSFIEATKEKQFQDYFINSFSNHLITSINDTIVIKRNYNHLEGSSRQLKSYEYYIKNTILRIYKEKKIELNIIIRVHKKSVKLFRLCESLNIFSRKLPKEVSLKIHLAINNVSEGDIKDFIQTLKIKHKELLIKEHYIKESTLRYSRVNALAESVNNLPDTSYTWIIDYDDFIMPEIAPYLQYILFDSLIVIGDSCIFEEEWESEKYPLNSTFKEKIGTDHMRYLLTGKNFIPVCSVIYKTKILKDVFKYNKLLGDYFEDYAILLHAAVENDISWFPLLFAGISYHGENTVLEKDRTHWNYSYVTFLSEVVNQGLMKEILLPLVELREEERKRLSTVDEEIKRLSTVEEEMKRLSAIEAEFDGFKKGLIWRGLMKYRRLKEYLSIPFKKD